MFLRLYDIYSRSKALFWVLFGVVYIVCPIGSWITILIHLGDISDKVIGPWALCYGIVQLFVFVEVVLLGLKSKKIGTVSEGDVEAIDKLESNPVKIVFRKDLYALLFASSIKKQIWEDGAVRAMRDKKQKEMDEFAKKLGQVLSESGSNVEAPKIQLDTFEDKVEEEFLDDDTMA